MNIHLKKANFNGLSSFFKRYGYYVILGLTLAVLTLIIMLTAPTNENDIDVGGGAIVFTSPVANATVLKGYSSEELQFNKTLNQWEAHKAIDFVAQVGTNVLAVYNGTVANIYTNDMEGTVIVIDHGNNLKTIYKSLDSETPVEVGATVTKGQVIGTASNSAANEELDEAHVHFEVWKENQKIDPSAYLVTTDK